MFPWVRKTLVPSALLASASLSALSVPAFAQSESSGQELAQVVALNNPDGVETVTVTARRKSENEQNVPISLTAITGDALAANGITSALKLPQLVPTLQVISFNARNTNIIVRGLGSNISLATDGIESGVGVYVDGVIYSRPATATFDLPDISAIEVLRGPQGTLYGKNTTAGAVNITTALPTSEFSAKGEVSFGNYGYKNFKGTVSGPLDDDGNLLAGLTAYSADRDGFIHNVTTGGHSNDFHDYGFRGQLFYQPTEDLSIRLIADYGNQHELCCIPSIVGVIPTLANGAPFPNDFYQRAARAGYTPLPISPFTRQTDANSTYHEYMEQGGLSAQVEWTYSGFTFTSITAGRLWNWDPQNDADQTALSIMTVARLANESRQFTQELRVSSPSDQPVEFNGGLYYFWEQDLGRGNQTFATDAPLWILGTDSAAARAALVNTASLSQSLPRIASYSAYGQAIWHVFPDLDLTGGVRFTYEDKAGTYSQTVQPGTDLSTIDPTVAAAAAAIRTNVGLFPLSYVVRAHKGTPSGLATATYHFSDDVSAYATYARGAKSGGINLAALPPGVNAVVDPEYVDNYEIGLKSVLLDNHLVVNADLFWENDANYQATLAELTTKVITYIANIPSVRSRGFEADVRAHLFEGLSTNLSLAYTDAIYVSYPSAPCPIEKLYVSPNICNLSGYPLPATSKWALSAGGEYDRPLGDLGFDSIEGYVGADLSYRSSFYSSADDSIYARIPGYKILNLRVGVRTDDEKYNAEFWLRNALDEDYYQTLGKVAFNSGGLNGLLGDPRTFGVTLRAKL